MTLITNNVKYKCEFEVELMKKMKEESKKAQMQRQMDAKRMATQDKEARFAIHTIIG